MTCKNEKNFYDDTLKLYKVFSDICDRKICYYIKNGESKHEIKESLLFLKSANNSLENSIKLLEKDDYINSLCLLRVAFEAIMISMAIALNNDVYDMYKHYNKNNYAKFLYAKHKNMKKKDPNHQIPNLEKSLKDFLSPYKIRKIVSQNYEKIYKEFFLNCENEKEVLEELNEFYRYLCDFTHPSIIKAYVYKLQGDRKNSQNIKLLLKQNFIYCKFLLILSLNYLYGNDESINLYKMYEVLFILNICLIHKDEKIKILLKKYDDYLYLNLNKNILTNSKRIKEIKDNIKELNQITDMNERITNIIVDLIIKFEALDIFKKYFPDIPI